MAAISGNPALNMRRTVAIQETVVITPVVRAPLVDDLVTQTNRERPRLSDAWKLMSPGS